MLRIALATALAATAASAPAGQNFGDRRTDETIARQLRGLEPGKPQDCITTSRSQGSTHSGNTILLQDRSGVRYISRFRGGCSIPSDHALILRTTSTQLCSGEIVQGRDLISGVSSGACAYGDFTPYRKPSR